MTFDFLKILSRSVFFIDKKNVKNYEFVTFYNCYQYANNDR